jgi:uncharacterized protein YodC (DUF2158 family)
MSDQLPGKTVRLKSGGPLMTVNLCDISTDMCECIWFYAASVYRIRVHAETLIPSSAERILSSESFDEQEQKFCPSEDDPRQFSVDSHGELYVSSVCGIAYDEFSDPDDPLLNLFDY